MQRDIDDYIERKKRLDREKNFPPKKLSYEELFNPDKKALIEKEKALLREAMEYVLLQEALETNDSAGVEILLKQGVLPNYRAFSNAANTGKWEAVLAFVRNNPDHVEKQECADIYGYVVLLAERNSQVELVNSLLDKKAPLYYCYANCYEYEGWCVLHFAVARGEIKLVERLLVECKVDPDWAGKNAPAPLQLAREYNQAEIAELLLLHGAQAIEPKTLFGISLLSEKVNENKEECEIIQKSNGAERKKSKLEIQSNSLNTDNTEMEICIQKNQLKNQLHELIKDDSLNIILNKTCGIRRLRNYFFLAEEKYSLYEYLAKLIEDDFSGMEKAQTVITSLSQRDWPAVENGLAITRNWMDPLTETTGSKVWRSLRDSHTVKNHLTSNNHNLGI